MPTVLTHAIVGAAFAPAGPDQVARGRLATALVVLSVLPDLDVLAFSAGIPYENPLGHRGFSHSLLFATLIGWIVACFGFPAISRYSRVWWRLFLLLTAITASHGFLDALTNGGLGVGFFIPFNTQRYFFSVQPLVVSPIGLDVIFHGSTIRALLSEILYIWVPLSAGFAVVFVARRLWRRLA